MSLNINSNNNSFYSLFGGSSSNSNTIFGGLEGSIGSLSQLRSGSYGKLIKSYYAKYDSDGNLKSDGSKKSKAETGNLGQIRNESAALNEAYSDILGSLIEGTNWTIAENNGSVIRSGEKQTFNITLVYDDVVLDGLVGDDDLSVTATGTFEDKIVGEDK